MSGPDRRNRRDSSHCFFAGARRRKSIATGKQSRSDCACGKKTMRSVATVVTVSTVSSDRTSDEALIAVVHQSYGGVCDED
jgi:hypothetical protein